MKTFNKLSMKKISLYKLMAVLITATIFFAACTKEQSDVKLNPKLATTQVLNLKSDSAKVVVFVVASGDGFSERGVCYSTSASPTTDNSKVICTDPSTASATFSVVLSELTYATTYYARGYGINANGTVYGKAITFTTLPILATVTTAEFTGITGTTATGGGEVTNTGGAAITARGIVYGANPNPTLADSKTTNGTGSGAFVSALTGLKGLTTYHVRAYATNSVGTAYGNDVQFTTLVSTRLWNVPGDYVAASYPGSTYADWSPDKSPQIRSIETAPDNLEGYVNMANTTNAWKFATKPSWDGPNYGDGGGGKLDANGGNFSSPAGYYKINVNAGTDPMTYTALATTWGIIGNATPGGWGTDTYMTYDAVKQVWKLGATLTQEAPPNDGMKFRANGTWDLNYGDTGADGTLEPGGTNIGISLTADYAITLDLSHPLAYTFSANRWGLIGDATGSWDTDQNMTWDATNQVFTITLDLVAGSIKFRANDAWDLNYGGADLNALTAGGDNIAITAAGNYTITFDPWALKATITQH
jgi:starch-binding outer membrane protein SusE/F